MNPRQTLKLVGTVEAVLELGFSATSVLDPDKLTLLSVATPLALVVALPTLMPFSVKAMLLPVTLAP